MAGFLDNLRSKREREKNAKAAILANEAQTGEEYLSSLSRHKLNQIPANMRSQGRGQALEIPMFSPDDLIGTGLITKGATLAASALSPLAAMAGLSSLAARRGVTTNPNRLAQLMSGQAGAFAIGKNPILHNGKEVGYLKLDDSGNALRIADIEITPSMRNQGIGSNAIKEVMAQAKESGKPVVLTSDAMRGKEAQKAQRALYQRLGFEKNSKLKTDGVKEEFVWQGEKQAPKTEFELAHELAQKNASLPIEQGGLGLPANNTAMDRARAMAGLKVPEYDLEKLLSGKVEVSPAKQAKPLFKDTDQLIQNGVVVDAKARQYLSSYLDHNQLDIATGELRGNGLSKAAELLSSATGNPTKAKFKDFTKEELKSLAESDVVKRAHEVGALKFNPMTKEQFTSASNLGIHKSPSYGRGNPGSEYKIGVVEGEPVYMRSANHWGQFGTNIGYKTPEEEALKQGLGVGDYYENVQGFGDPFARVGKQMNNWELPSYERGNIGYGYVPLSALSGKLPEKNFVSNLDTAGYADLPIVKLPNGQLRSRFAAFDPMQRNSSNILAGGAIGAAGLTLADLLNQEQYQ